MFKYVTNLDNGGCRMLYTTRTIDIIEVLLATEQHITVEEIADKLKISKRTVFREMEDVEDLLSTYGITLSKKTRVGLKVIATQEQIAAYRSAMAIRPAGAPLFSQEERLNHLTHELLKSREPQKLFFFAKQLHVSEATISNDMDKLEAWFTKRGLQLLRKPGYGVYVEGNEKAFRKAIVDYLYQNYAHDDLIGLIQGGQSASLGLIDKEILLKVGQILKGFESQLEKKLTDQAYMSLMVHMAIAVQRIQRGEGIHMSDSVLASLRHDEQFIIGLRIADELSERFDILVPEDEVGYITMHLKGSKLRTSALVEEHDFIISNFELSRLTAKMIKRFKALSGYDFKEDERLLIGLASHLRPALTRMKLGLDIRNPLLSKIQEMYPEIYAMTVETTVLIQEAFAVQVPDEETGFLAMHFGAAIERHRKQQQGDKAIRGGVVCASGIGTSSLLSSRLSKLVPRLEIAGQFGKEDIETGNAELDGIECLISTVSIEKTELPVVVVDPLLSELDVERIKQVVAILQQDLKPYKEKPEIHSGGSIDRIRRINGLSSGILAIVEGFAYYRIQPQFVGGLWQDVQLIEQIVLTIFKPTDAYERSADIRFERQVIDRLLEREAIGSTVLRGEGVKLLHAKIDGLEGLKLVAINLCAIYDHPMSDGTVEKIDTIIVMLVPEKANKEHMEAMSHISRSLVEDPELLTVIREKGENDIRTFIHQKLDVWFQRQLKEGGADL